MVEPLVGSVLPLASRTVKQLDALLLIMGTKATRQDGEKGSPLKGDKIVALAGISEVAFSE